MHLQTRRTRILWPVLRLALLRLCVQRSQAPWQGDADRGETFRQHNLALQHLKSICGRDVRFMQDAFCMFLDPTSMLAQAIAVFALHIMFPQEHQSLWLLVGGHPVRPANLSLP